MRMPMGAPTRTSSPASVPLPDAALPRPPPPASVLPPALLPSPGTLPEPPVGSGVVDPPCPGLLNWHVSDTGSQTDPAGHVLPPPPEGGGVYPPPPEGGAPPPPEGGGVYPPPPPPPG